MRNPVLILTHNNLELTKACVASVKAQDIPTTVLVFDNGSTDGTVEWLESHVYPYEELCSWHEPTNTGVSNGWNCGLDYFFSNRDDCPDHVLVLNNDTILPPWFYSELLSYDAPFVTGVGVDSVSQIQQKAPKYPLSPHPDFSGWLIRKEAWDKIGCFDETMKIYASDCDYHLRGWFAGVEMGKANVPYYHVNSQTLKRSTPEGRAAIEAQADRDRARLKEKWGVVPGTPEYEALFSVENFGRDAK